MDSVKKTLKTRAGLFTALLSYQGFSHEQARSFLPQLALVVRDLVRQEEIAELLQPGVALEIGELLQMIDIEAVASKASISPVLAQLGTDMLLPRLFELFIESRWSVTHGERMLLIGATDRVAGEVELKRLAKRR